METGRGHRGHSRWERGWQHADLPPADDAASWLAGRLPDGWFEGAAEVTVDRDEIVIVGTLAPPPTAAEASDDASWLSERIIVTRKGEWLAYANSCQKQDGRIPDIFLARGSDGHWYYSTYHFCVGMVVLRMEDQPEDLAAFTKTYFLRTFDGQSDDCLQKTWPPGSR